MEIKIRSLKVKDCRFLTKVLKRLISEMKETWIQNSVKINEDDSEDKSKENTEKAGNFFLLIIEKALDCFDDDISDWLASLLDISIDDYLELPFDTDMKIFRQIIDDENFSFFLRKLLALFNLKDQSENIIRMLKERYDSTTD